MSRLGLAPDNALELPDGVDIVGVATHLASADTDNPADPTCQTAVQLRRFAAVTIPGMRHAANSAGTIRFPASRLDAVRVGLAMYGNGVAPPPGLVQAMRLCSEVSQVRRVAARRQTAAAGGAGRAYLVAAPVRLLSHRAFVHAP